MIVILTLVSSSILSMNSKASPFNESMSFALVVSGKMISNFVKASCVAPFSRTAFLASSKLNGAALLKRPVTAPYYVHPLLSISSTGNSPGNSPVPTLVKNDFKTTITSETFVGPTPRSEQIAAADTSFDVTKG